MRSLVVAVLVVAAASAASAQSTAFTYQGQLKSGGQLANGPFDLQFRLFDAATGGTQQGPTLCLNDVAVASGLFTAQVDFGQQFAAPTPRFLEIEVRRDTGLDCSNLTGFTALSRQLITAAPLADHAKAAYALDAPDGSPAGAVVVDNAGQVGIGTAVPSATLHVNGNLGVGVANIPAGLTSELGGTNTPLLNLDVNFRHPNRNTGLVGGAIRIDSRDDGVNQLFQFAARAAGLNTEAIVAVLTRTGRLALGGSSFFTSFAQLELNGADFDNVVFNVSGHAKHGRIQYFLDHLILWNDVSSGGGAELEDDGSWSTPSDQRLKTDIAPAQGLLSKALALRPAEYFLKDQDRDREPRRYLGLIAQEVRAVLPSLVYGTARLSLNYDRIGVVAIGAIQEQQRIIEEQRKTNQALTERVEKLEAMMRAMTADRAARTDPVGPGPSGK